MNFQQISDLILAIVGRLPAKRDEVINGLASALLDGREAPNAADVAIAQFLVGRA